MAKQPNSAAATAPTGNPQQDIPRAEFDALVAQYQQLHDPVKRREFYKANPVLGRLYSNLNHHGE